MLNAPATKNVNALKADPADGRANVVVIGRDKNRTQFVGAAEQFLRSYRLIFGLTVVICLLGTALFVYSVYVANVVDVRASINQKAAVLEQRQAELEKLKSIKINFTQLEGPAKKIVEVLPMSKDLPAIFVQMEALAVKHNLFLASIDVADDKDAAASKKKLPLQKLFINVSLTGGDYFALKGFLADVEKNLRLLDVRSLAYAPDTMSFNLSLAAYFYND